MARKIVVVINSRANYGRIKSFLAASKNYPELNVLIVLGASAILERYGDLRELVKKDGFTTDFEIHSVVEGGDLVSMPLCVGLGILQLVPYLNAVKPDIVLTVADRFETMATAIAASYMNIPLAHTQGGEVSGSIDESVRHSISKLAHLHFPATCVAAENLVKMGENPGKVFWVGCPAIDLALAIEDDVDLVNVLNSVGGVGPEIDPAKPFLLVSQHPVTTKVDSVAKQINSTILAVDTILDENRDMQCVWLWPNVDAGTDVFSKKLRKYRENNPSGSIRFYKNFSPENYVRLLKKCEVLIGNSSSGLRECAALGVKSVNIGDRQQLRERAANVLDVPFEEVSIELAIKTQLSAAPPGRSTIYGNGNAGEKMAKILASCDLSIEKTLSFLVPASQ